MAGRSPSSPCPSPSLRWRTAVPCGLLWLAALGGTAGAATAVPPAPAPEPGLAAANLAPGAEPADPSDTGDIATVRPSYGPPGAPEGIPSDAVLEKEGAVIGQVIIDNQNIFNTEDPKDDKSLFRLANKLHIKTRANVVRQQLLFKPGDRYSRRLLDESERLLRSASYFYDAWIRPVRYHDGKVDLKVTTKDVWTLNPGFNYGRSGGTNSTGLKLEEGNLLGTATSLKFSYENNIDRSGSSVELGNRNVLGSWTAVDLMYANLSDGETRGLTVTRPFYSLDSRWAASFAALDATQIDPLYDRGEIVDQFQDQHEYVQAYYGWSRGLRDGWVQRWTAGVTYDEHRFAAVTTSTGTTKLLPADRRFVYPFIEFDLVQDDFLKLWNHDQIGRTEDFTIGTSASLRLGYADADAGSTSSAVMILSSANRGFRWGGSTLLLAGDFSGRLESGTLRNGIADAAVRYYVEQSKNWLFFTTLLGTKGWNLDLDNQILLGGDNGMRGYPLRYQSGTARALFTLEQRYFTDWYPFRLLRVGGAVFFDAGRTWGQAPLAAPSLGILTDAGFGLRLGSSRSGLGNVIHVDLAFPFNGDPSISRVQFLVQTEVRF